MEILIQLVKQRTSKDRCANYWNTIKYLIKEDISIHSAPMKRKITPYLRELRDKIARINIVNCLREKMQAKFLTHILNG
jgi:shikimate 5-dehydrogenase